MNLFSKNLLTLAFAISTLFFSGCATKRGEVALQVPTAQAEAVPSNGKQIYINSVVDKRVFEVKPPEPNIPSLDPSEVQNADIKARAVARKRGAYGMALGDILLKENQTVSSVVKDSLKEALKAKGYQVIENKDQTTLETYIADVKIVKFWSWLNMGFIYTISCEIETNVDLKKGSDVKSYDIHVKAADTYAFAPGSESDYMPVIQKALQKYIEEAKTEIK